MICGDVLKDLEEEKILEEMRPYSTPGGKQPADNLSGASSALSFAVRTRSGDP